MKLYHLLLMTIVLTFIGCAGTPTWEDISQDDIVQWKELHVDAEQAQTYRTAAIPPETVKNWMDVGLKNQEDILAWNKAGFTPANGANWIKGKFTAQDAETWSKEKFTAEEATNWTKGNFDLKGAIDNRNKGLQPIQDN